MFACYLLRVKEMGIAGTAMQLFGHINDLVTSYCYHHHHNRSIILSGWDQVWEFY